MITIRDYLEGMGEPPSSRAYLLANRHLIPGYSPVVSMAGMDEDGRSGEVAAELERFSPQVNPPAVDTGD